MNKDFLHYTVRAEWFVFQYKTEELEEVTKVYGPFPSQDLAKEFVVKYEEKTDEPFFYKYTYEERQVPVDPILLELTETIAYSVESFLDKHMIRNPKKKKPLYFSDKAVRRHLKKLANHIRVSSFKINQENEYYDI